MNIVRFMEQIATTPHQCKNLNELLKSQPTQIKNAFKNNKPELLKALFSKENKLANRTTIFEM